MPCLLWMAVVARNEERGEQIDELLVEEKNLLFHTPCLFSEWLSEHGTIATLSTPLV